jgi:hypothetical protein
MKANLNGSLELSRLVLKNGTLELSAQAREFVVVFFLPHKKRGKTPSSAMCAVNGR